jgi:tyrosyl-tRNA synthetase
MSIPDTLIVRYLKYACLADAKEVDDVEKGLSSGAIHPRSAKVDVARRIVARYHGVQSANDAVAEFDRIFVNKDVPDDVPEWNPEWGQGTIPIVDLLAVTGMAPSKSEARRLIQQGAVQINGAKITDMTSEIDVTTQQLLKVGKLRFLRIVPAVQ